MDNEQDNDSNMTEYDITASDHNKRTRTNDISPQSQQLVQIPIDADAQASCLDNDEEDVSEDSDEEYRRIRDLWGGRKQQKKPKGPSFATFKKTMDGYFEGDLSGDLDNPFDHDGDIGSADFTPAFFVPENPPHDCGDSDPAVGRVPKISYEQALNDESFSPSSGAVQVDSSPLIKFTLDDDASVTPSLVEQYLSFGLDEPPQPQPHTTAGQYDSTHTAHTHVNRHPPHTKKRRESTDGSSSHGISHKTHYLDGTSIPYTKQCTVVDPKQPFHNAESQLEGTLYTFHSTFFSALPKSTNHTGDTDDTHDTAPNGGESLGSDDVPCHDTHATTEATPPPSNSTPTHHQHSPPCADLSDYLFDSLLYLFDQANDGVLEHPKTEQPCASPTTD